MEFSDSKLVLSDSKWINEKCVNVRLGIRCACVCKFWIMIV